MTEHQCARCGKTYDVNCGDNCEMPYIIEDVNEEWCNAGHPQPWPKPNPRYTFIKKGGGKA